MSKLISFIALFSSYAMGQVSPFGLPEIISSLEVINSNLINQITFNFQNSDKEIIANENKYIWQKTFNFDFEQRIVLRFNNQDCLEELFLINSNGEFAGPYNINSINKTNPFKAKQLTVQISSSSNCSINNQSFIIEKYKDNINKIFTSKPYYQKRENPVILITGYWPPTNEMIRPFSQNLDLNPDGWIGDDWEESGYDIISFFPEFSDPECDNCGQGYGDLEVDYQDTSEDYWPIVESVKPIAIITFSRGYIDYSWELEYNYYNRLNWTGDFYPPYLPTPNPPDDSVENYFIRNSSLPMSQIMDNILDENIGLDSYIDWDGDPGHYVSEFMGYHGVWYHDINQLGSDKCIASGHIHVGGLIDIQTAKRATDVSLRTLIDYLDQFSYTLGDINQDNIIDILDLVMTVNYILGIQDFEDIQIYAADMNEDGIVNIQDIINIINIILDN